MDDSSANHGSRPAGRQILNIHALLPCSRVNGPGLRAVIWLQGCPRRCPGCFNPEILPDAPRQLWRPERLWEWTRRQDSVEGVTVSGGEPLLQMEPLLAYLRLLRAASPLSVMIYTGYYLDEVTRLPCGGELLRLVDVLVDGPYERERPATDGVRGSTNQTIHLLTTRYTPTDFVEGQRFELTIGADGRVVRTGVPVRPLRRPPDGPPVA